MQKDKKGMWADYLSCNEFAFSMSCVKELQGVEEWDLFLSSPNIKNALEIVDTIKTDDELFGVKSALFEIRFAYLLYQAELSANYEYCLNKENTKTVDFKVFNSNFSDTLLFIELSSLRESQVQKDQTYKYNDNFFGCCLSGDDDVSEYFKAQKILIEKAGKFSIINSENQINVILLDMRSSILKSSDYSDYYNIVYGSQDLKPVYQRWVKSMGLLFPGLYSKAHPGNEDVDLVHLRNSIHFFGFVVEKEYKKEELIKKIYWYKNPYFENNSSFDINNFFVRKRSSIFRRIKSWCCRCWVRMRNRF